MQRKFHKVGRIEAVAGSPKQIEIPANLGVICNFYLMPKNGTAAAASTAKVLASIETANLKTFPNNGTAKELVRDQKIAKLYRRELHYGAIFGVTNSAAVLGIDPSAALFVAESTRAYMNIGTADQSKLVLELKFADPLDGVTGCDVWIEYEPRSEKLGAYGHLATVTQKVPATGGDVVITHLPKNADGSFVYQKIDIEVPADMAIDYVSIVVNNNQDAVKQVPVELINRSLIDNGRTPQDGVVTLDFAKEAFANYFLPGQMVDFQLIPHFVAEEGAAEAQIDIDYELLYI